jgi:hypothetical protein
MFPFGVTIPVTVPQRSEIPEGLLNYPVFIALLVLNKKNSFLAKKNSEGFVNNLHTLTLNAR